jgi:hypothetical protein
MLKRFLSLGLLAGLCAAVGLPANGQEPDTSGKQPPVFKKAAPKSADEPKKADESDNKAAAKDDKAPAKKVEKKDETPEFEVTFSDSSQVKMSITLTEIPITTQFGKLVVPIKEVKKIERQVKVNAKQVDRIETTDFPIQGSIELTQFKVQTKQFGETTLKFDMVKALRKISGTDIADGIEVDAEKYAKQNFQKWLETSIEVDSNQSLKITATGKIDQWPQTPGQYISTPRGTGASVSIPFGLTYPTQVNAVDNNIDRGFGAGGPPGMPPGMMARVRPSSGSLIGKIGENGTAFVIGESFHVKKAPASGKLYLIIAPSNWGNESTGKYEVKVAAE